MSEIRRLKTVDPQGGGRGTRDEGRRAEGSWGAALHAVAPGVTGRSYRLKDHAVVAGKEDKNKKDKSKSNEPLAAEPAS